MVIYFIFISQVVYTKQPHDAERWQKALICFDGVFAKHVGQYKELEKYYAEFKVFAKNSHLRLEECGKIEDAKGRDQ